MGPLLMDGSGLFIVQPGIRIPACPLTGQPAHTRISPHLPLPRPGSNLILRTPFPRGYAICFLKRPGKMELAGVSHGIAYVLYGQLCQLQQLRGLGHAVAD